MTSEWFPAGTVSHKQRCILNYYKLLKDCYYTMHNTLAWNNGPWELQSKSESKSIRFHRSDMTIFFGANSGNVFGKVTVKRPSSIVALIWSSCAIKDISRHSFKSIWVRKKATYLYALRELKRTPELAMEAFAQSISSVRMVFRLLGLSRNG